MKNIQFTGSACCFNSLSDITAEINKFWKLRWSMECPGFCFRGGDKATYDLNPSILRDPFPKLPDRLAKVENELWVEFRLRSKPLLGHHVTGGWEALLTMQQYGFPTRLLDWSKSLAVAAYFAVRNIDIEEDGVVWVMASRRLMEARGVKDTWLTVVGDPSIESLSLRESGENLEEFMSQIPVPLSPDHLVSRIIAQRGMYTLHSFAKNSLEELAIEDRRSHGDACFLHKIRIPSGAKEGFRSELSLVAGISEETIFPDLEGFARDYVNQYKRQHKYKSR